VLSLERLATSSYVSASTTISPSRAVSVSLDAVFVTVADRGEVLVRRSSPRNVET
jgi:hypothetical protein